MASFRRTLSPYHDRIHQNGTNNVNGAYLDESPRKSVRFPRFISLVFPGKLPRKYHLSWKRSLTRCLLFFFIGFLLGLTPFGHVNDLQLQFHDNRDLGVIEITPPHFSAALHGDDHMSRREDNISVRAVNLGVQERKKGDVESVSDEKLVDSGDPYLMSPPKQLIVITPTYNRVSQAYFLNRVGQVLRVVKPPLLWIVVESGAASMETAELLRKTGVMYRHLVCRQNMTDVKDRGVYQRNTALEHIEHHRLDGIVYFADDDNVYSLELFESMREIRRFGTWPVAMLAPGKNKAILEGPVCNGSQVVGWHTNEKSSRLRRFHVDMSGFAFNSTILWDPKRWRRPTLNPIRQLDTVKEGFQETTFISQVVEDESQMEGIPPGCSRIMNWHLHIDARGLSYPKGWMLQKNLNAITPIK